MKYIFLPIVCLFLSLNIAGQNSKHRFSNKSRVLFQDEELEDEGRGFSISMNMGVYFGNKKSALLYNGNCYLDFEGDPNGMQCNTIEERIGPSLSYANSPYNQILQFYNNKGDGVVSFHIPNDSYPTNMRYSPAFSYGINISYYMDYENAIVLNVNSAKLIAKDAFTVIFVGSSPQPNEPTDIRPFTVWGEETRLNLMLGYKKGWGMSETSRFFMEFGGTMLSVKLEENKVEIGGREYSLLVGGNNPSQPISFQPRTYTGFGFYVSPGMQFSFNEKLTMDIGLNFARENMKVLELLPENFIVKTNLWHSMLYLRFGI